MAPPTPFVLLLLLGEEERRGGETTGRIKERAREERGRSCTRSTQVGQKSKK